MLLEAGGTPLLLRLFLAAAASTSPAMSALADASAPVLLAPQHAPATSPCLALRLADCALLTLVVLHAHHPLCAAGLTVRLVLFAAWCV